MDYEATIVICTMILTSKGAPSSPFLVCWVDNLIFSVIHFGQTLLPDTTRGNVSLASSSSLTGRLQDPVSTISLGTSAAVTVTHHYGRHPRHRSSRVESAKEEEVVVVAKGGKGNIIIGKVMSPK